MKTEKHIRKDSPHHPAKLDGSGSLQFVDNRSMNLPLQRIGEDEDDTLQGKFDKSDPTRGGRGRIFANETEQYRTA